MDITRSAVVWATISPGMPMGSVVAAKKAEAMYLWLSVSSSKFCSPLQHTQFTSASSSTATRYHKQPNCSVRGNV